MGSPTVLGALAAAESGDVVEPVAKVPGHIPGRSRDRENGPRQRKCRASTVRERGSRMPACRAHGDRRNGYQAENGRLWCQGSIEGDAKQPLFAQGLQQAGQHVEYDRPAIQAGSRIAVVHEEDVTGRQIANQALVNAFWRTFPGIERAPRP